MERIAIVGASIHGTDVGGLEQFARPAPGREQAFLRDLADTLGASELVFIATCNRVEVVYAREEGDPPEAAEVPLVAGALRRDASVDPHALAAVLRQRIGLAAARHLFRMASSLDSLVLGEDQILAQVRDAYARASDIGLVGPLLGPLFHHALAVGKQARADTGLARHPVSVVTLAVQTLSQRPDAGRMRIAVLGAGEMGRLVARALSAAGMKPAVIANRGLEKARDVASDCGATACTLDEFRTGRHPVDAVVSATSAPGLVLDEAVLLRLAAVAPSGRPLLGVDLAVPRDLAAPSDPRLEVVDIDALRSQADHNRALRAEAAALAEQIVEHKVETWARRFTERAAAEVVTEMQSAADEVLKKELAGLLSGRLAHLPEEDRRAVERWARTTFGRVMYLPVAALKRLASDMSAGDDEHSTDGAAGEDAAGRAPPVARGGRP